MKIGILTYHWVFNFGANLQVLSTISYLKCKGHIPFIINWIPINQEETEFKRIDKAQANIHQEFVLKYLPVTRICREKYDIINVIIEYEIEGIIIGSDALLRYIPFLSRIIINRKQIISLILVNSNNQYPNPYWGDFLNELPELPSALMSVSCQNMAFRYVRGKVKNQIGKSLNRFRYISVRDEWTRKMVKYFTKNQMLPTLTPDPVFAFNNNVGILFSKEEILKKYNLPENYFLVSFYTNLPREWMKELINTSKKNKLTCVGLAMPEGLKDSYCEININTPLSPLDWYYLIKYSNGYVGERMHPLVISLHNAVPFFSFDTYGIIRFRFKRVHKSSKIYDLLYNADMLTNRYSASRFSHLPSPDLIIEKLISFNKIKAKIFNELQYEKYLLMMENIERSLKK